MYMKTALAHTQAKSLPYILVCSGNRLSPNIPYYIHHCCPDSQPGGPSKWLSMGRKVKGKAQRTRSTNSEIEGAFI